MRYTQEFKESVLKRLLPPNSESVLSVSRSTRVSHQTLRNWIRDAHMQEMIKELPSVPESHLSSAEKFKVVVETLSMSETELSSYAREHGLYVDEIREWRETCQNANETAEAASKRLKKELKATQKELGAVRKDLRKKEKALAETAALLVLRKKAEAIWGESGDD